MAVPIFPAPVVVTAPALAPAQKKTEAEAVLPESSPSESRSPIESATNWKSAIGSGSDDPRPASIERSASRPSSDSSSQLASLDSDAPTDFSAAEIAPPAPSAWRLRTDWASALLLIWAVGAFISISRLLVGSWKIRAIARAAQPLCDREWRTLTRELSERLSVSRHVRLGTTPEVAVAVTAGVRRPVLLLHDGARKWAADRRRVVLLHELAHVRRRDWLTFLLAELAVAVYWFHPLAWLARREARTSAERACDDLVLESGTKPSVYAAHLLGIVRSLKPGVGGALPVLAMARPSQFEGRMRAILNPGLQRRGPSRGQFRGAALGLFSAVLALAALQPWASANAAAIPPGTAFSNDLLPAKEGQSAATAGKIASAKPHREKKPCPQKKLVPGTSVRPATASSGVVPASAVVEPATARPSIAAAPSAPALAPLAPIAAEPGGFVSAVRSFVRTLAPESKPVPAAAPAGLVLAGKGKHRSGGDWYSKGMDHHHDEDYDEAIAAFQKSIEEGYKEDASSYNIACGYALKGDKDRAFEWLRKAQDLGFPVARYLTDDDLDSLHSDPRWAALRKELRDNPSSEVRGQRKRANERLQTLMADSKTPGSRFFESGRTLYKSEDYAASAKAYHRAAELGYRAGTASYNEACSLSLNGDKAAALEALQRSLDNGFDQPSMFRDDDDLDNIRGEKRFKELESLADELEGPSVSWEGHIFRSESRNQWRKAADHAREVAARHPQYGRVWFNIGFAEIKGDRPEPAAQAFQKALELGYRKPTTLYNLACSYAKLGQKDKAFDFLFKALDAGFDESSTLRHDDDLDNLRGDARFRKAVKVAEAKDGKDEDDD